MERSAHRHSGLPGKAARLVLAGLAVAIGSIAFLLSSSAAASTVSGASVLTPEKRIIGGLYNTRYCEIFAISPATETGFPVKIYNTIGVNDCPTAIWESLDFQAIARDEGVFAAAPNGPRRWVIDAVVGGQPGPVKDVGGLMMREVASLTATSLSPSPFTVTTIRRTNNWIFRKGRTIREMISPAGRRYVMQAYTNTVDPSLSISTLNTVGANPMTQMPPGWKFRTRKLKRKLVVAAKGGEAKIIRDGLRSVYQLYTVPRT